MAIIVTGAGSFVGVPDGGPYPVLEWPLGGLSTIGTDIPVMAVFLFLFFCGFIIHLILLFVNLARGRFIVQFLMACRCLSSKKGSC
jgi:hypothetical protein